MLQQAADRKLNFIGARRLSYLLAFVQGDAQTMARELEASVGVRQTNAAFGWQAQVIRGRPRQGGARAVPPRHPDVAPGRLQRSGGAVDHGRCRDARDRRAMRRGAARGPRGLRSGRDNTTLERASRVLALCGDRVEALKLSNELAQRFPEATSRFTCRCR